MSYVWQPQPGPQWSLMQCPVSDILFGGARGGGKTDGIIGKWAQHQDQGGQYARGIVFRRTMTELDEFYNRTVEVYPAIGAVWRAKSSSWHHANGSRIKLRYLDKDQDADKYQGHSYTFSGFDELGAWPSPDPIDKIRATLRSPHGIEPLFLASANPGGRGHAWIKERYIVPWRDNGGRPWFVKTKTGGFWRTFIPSRLQDNRILMLSDPGYVDRLAQSGPSWLVKAWLEGDWDASFEGEIFKREWWRKYTTPPRPEEIKLVLQSWDTAHEKHDNAAYSVCQTWGMTQTHYYLLDMWRGKVDFPALKRAFVSEYERHRPHVVIVEYKASGIPLLQTIEAETRIPVMRVQPDADKIARANATAAIVESGKAVIPANAPWTGDFLDEVTSAGASATYWDVTDAMTQALRYMHGGSRWETGSV